MKHVPLTDKHRAFRDQINAVIAQHTLSLTAQEILAIVSQIVGEVIALQDEQLLAPDTAIEIVMENMRLGNALAHVK